MNQPAKKILKLAFKILITVGGLCYVFYKVPLNDALNLWTSKALLWLLLIFALTILFMAIQANRWRGLLLNEGRNIPFKSFYAYIALGYFFNNLLPSNFGGDAVKTIAFGRRFGKMANSVAAIIVSRIMGLLAMFFSFFIALPFVAVEYNIPMTYVAVVCILALIALLVIFLGLFSDKIKLPAPLTTKFPFLLKLQDAFCLYRKYKKEFFLSGLDSIWLQAITIIIHWAYFKAMGVDVNFAVITVFTTIMVTFTMLPISINGIGIRENVQISLYTGLLGIPADIVLASTLFSYMPLLFQTIQGAIAFAIIKEKNPSPK